MRLYFLSSSRARVATLTYRKKGDAYERLLSHPCMIRNGMETWRGGALVFLPHRTRSAEELHSSLAKCLPPHRPFPDPHIDGTAFDSLSVEGDDGFRAMLRIREE